MDYFEIIQKSFWMGIAALGFAVLFNVPKRTLFIIAFIGSAAGMVKLLCMGIGENVILSSFMGAAFIGILSIPAAHNKHAPPLVFSIPSVIPLIPGIFAYRTMLGLMQMANDTISPQFQEILHQTINNGLKTIFILIALSAGVAIPMLVTRKLTIKRIKKD